MLNNPFLIEFENCLVNRTTEAPLGTTATIELATTAQTSARLKTTKAITNSTKKPTRTLPTFASAPRPSKPTTKAKQANKQQQHD